MTHSLDLPFCESFDWDESEVRDLVCTTPLRFDEHGQPTGYEAEQLFDDDAPDLLSRFR